MLDYLANAYLVIFLNFYSILVKDMFQVFDSGNIKNPQHANTCILLSTCPCPKSPYCLPQKCLQNLVVTHHWLKLFEGAYFSYLGKREA